MTAPIPRPDDVVDPAIIAAFRAAGYWQGQGLHQASDHWAREYPGQIAVSDGFTQVTNEQLRARAYRFGAVLRDLGVRPGDRVQVQLPNWTEFVVAYLGITRIGAILVPTMPIYRHDEVLYVLRHCGAKVLVVAAEFRGFDYVSMVDEIRSAAPDLQHVIVVRGEASPGFLRFEDLTGDGEPPDDALGDPPSADAPHCIIYTSGTESRPKGCLHTFNTMSYTSQSLGRDIMSLGPGEVMFMPSPVTHATGIVVGVATPLFLGAGIHLLDVWDPLVGLERISAHQCTVSMAATPFVQMVLDRLRADPSLAPLIASLRIWVCAGAPIPELMLRSWADQVPHCAVLPLYGSSEGMAVTCCSVGDSPSHLLTDGKPFPGITLEIRDEDGRLLPPDTDGEIWHGGPGLMLGYWGDPERTAAVIDERRVSRSGDVGRISPDGYLRVTGRIKDIIIRGGINISATEIENHLLTHSQVSAVAVVGVPDQRLGERACAFVVPWGTPPTLAELTAFLRDERRIAMQKLPEMLQIVDSLPITSSGKVQKFLLRDRARSYYADPLNVPPGQ
jgi:acyl-CoA synthetase (AMP-forming)/AMP-acid ligase II